MKIIVFRQRFLDGSLARLHERYGEDPGLVLQENRQNLGFARGNNVALNHAEGDYILYLNPDCVVAPETIPAMLQLLQEHPDFGMAGCLIRNTDGSEQAGCRRRTPTPWRTLMHFLPFRKLLKSPRWKGFVLSDQPLPETWQEVEAISGAFMLVRRSALEQVGVLDEGYFIHCEDLDWCYRFLRAGWKIMFVPNVAITHVKGACSTSAPIFIEWHKHRGMVRFYDKFFRTEYSPVLMALVKAAIWARFSWWRCALGGRCHGKLRRNRREHSLRTMLVVIAQGT